MTILRSALQKRASLANGDVPLTSKLLLGLFGAGSNSRAGVSVNSETAMGLTAVYRCVSILSGGVAGSDLEIQDRKTHQVKENALLDYPSNLFSNYEFWELIMVHLLLHGDAFIFKQNKHSRTGLPQALFPMNPTKVEVKWVSTGDMAALAIPEERLYEVTLKDGTVVGMTDDDVWHIPGLGFDGLNGRSPITLAREALGVGIAADEYAGTLFGKGTMMSGFLKTDKRLDKENAAALKQRWQALHSGLDNANEIAVLDSGTDFHALTMKPADAQFIEVRAFNVTEIARLFGLPNHLVNAAQDRAARDVEQENIGFWLFTLRNWLRRLESRVDKDLLPRGDMAKFKANEYLRGDTKTRSGAWLLARKANILTINEIREDEGRPRIADPKADDLFTPVEGGEEVGGADPGSDTSDQGDGDGPGSSNPATNQ